MNARIAEALAPAPRKSRPIRVLVVDDEEDYRLIVHDILTSAGMEVRAAEDGVAGLGALESFAADIVLVDWMMPKMDGEGFCRALREDPKTKDIPIVMLTVKQKSGDEVDALYFGVDDYLVKPFNPEQLIVRVRAALQLAKNDAGGDHP